jgi:hypothetical protein
MGKTDTIMVLEYNPVTAINLAENPWNATFSVACIVVIAVYYIIMFCLLPGEGTRKRKLRTM